MKNEIRTEKSLNVMFGISKIDGNVPSQQPLLMGVKHTNAIKKFRKKLKNETSRREPER